MESYLISSHFDLISPDGKIQKLKQTDEKTLEIEVLINNISDAFAGFDLEEKNIYFNLKSTLAQIGLHGKKKDLKLNKNKRSANIKVHLIALNDLAKEFLKYITVNMYVGKLFAEDNSRRVREPEYLIRMLGRCDRLSRPLLHFGTSKREDLKLKKIENHTVAFLPIKKGIVTYTKEIYHFLFALSKILKKQNISSRELIKIYQTFKKNEKAIVKKNQVLLVKSEPLYIRTAFAKVREKYLPKGYHHTSACILEPNTFASGDIYEFYGSSTEELKEVPLEFYTLEPHREFVFFEDRDQLQKELEKPRALFNAFKTAPQPANLLTSVFVVKGTQLKTLKEKDWITRDPKKNKLPGLKYPTRQALLIQNYIKDQPSYPFLKAVEDDLITSQGILLTRHFPSPLLKKMLLSDLVQRNLKGIYFQYPSRSNDDFFSQEDRAFLLDLAKFAIPVFWVDKVSKKVLQYVVKPNKDAGMFVPINLIEKYKQATFFGVYGSNLIKGSFEQELEKVLSGILKLQKQTKHPLLQKLTPLALVTGGGPGAMEVGNRVAKNLNILSCANVVDFRPKDTSVVNEQKINPHIDAKMTYRLDRLVERQAEFYLDFPIFLMGGIGTDFEYELELVKKKTGAAPINPILLFGRPDYWEKKITSRFQINKKTGTIKGSEWVSNCFYVVENAEQCLRVYKDFFEYNLPIGKKGPIYEKGFCSNY